jgi:hypothetical protein
MRGRHHTVTQPLLTTRHEGGFEIAWLMQLHDLVIDDPQRGVFRVHRSTMTSDDVLALERERIFERCWLYVGHESEIAQPGSYRRRQIAGRPLVLVRGSDGAVRVVQNTCRHRGAMVFRAHAGSAEVFTCCRSLWAKGCATSWPARGCSRWYAWICALRETKSRSAGLTRSLLARRIAARSHFRVHSRQNPI